MLFNSLEFVLFFLVVVPVALVLRGTPRRLVLLAASFVFYMAFIPAFALILVAVILIDYLAGLWMERRPVEQRRVIFLVSVIANIGILAVFKYAQFVLDNINSLFRLDGAIPNLSWTLPIGLSFHTFQALTVNCARCHDHKFDPIPAKDYYKLTSVFRGVTFGTRTAASPQENESCREQLKVLAKVVGAGSRLLDSIFRGAGSDPRQPIQLAPSRESSITGRRQRPRG